ncbi:hypothetical protein EXN66_Car008749 [Channa argus]|uniref:Uncharacterized protein n=1 Tax=Channa argus TaxID=215402 RepID=A0A6G1PSB4_CHAAH|nr:hypothetical protein EXN66_Car008749 [Channa argus]
MSSFSLPLTHLSALIKVQESVIFIFFYFFHVIPLLLTYKACMLKPSQDRNEK